MRQPTLRDCRTILLIGAAVSAATAARAQEETAMPNEFEALKSCRSIAGDQERLACFDAAVGVVVAAQESGDLRIVDKEAANQTRRRLFGFALPDIGLFGDGKVGDEQQLDLLETTITSAQQIRRNAWTFQTAEGAVWQINNVPFRLRPLEPGQKVVFKKAALNSYFIRIDDQTGVKGTRIG